MKRAVIDNDADVVVLRCHDGKAFFDKVFIRDTERKANSWIELSSYRELIDKHGQPTWEGWQPDTPTRDQLKTEIQRLHGVVDKLLDHCPDAECSTCAEAVCPHGEPFHFHHDGCPACHFAENPS